MDPHTNSMQSTLSTSGDSSVDGPLTRGDILTIVQEVVRHLQPAGQDNPLNLQVCQL